MISISSRSKSVVSVQFEGKEEKQSVRHFRSTKIEGNRILCNAINLEGRTRKMNTQFVFVCWTETHLPVHVGFAQKTKWALRKRNKNCFNFKQVAGMMGCFFLRSACFHLL